MQELLLKILISLALGALVGIEREKRMKGKVFAGFRTFMLVCLFGLLSAYLSSYSEFIIPISLFSVAIIVFSNLYRKIREKRQRGVTTELAFFITYFIGVILHFEQYPYILSIALSFLLTLILVLKESLHEFAHRVTVKEIEDFIIFGLTAFVIYPLLPSTPLDPFQILSLPFIWKGIVFIFGLSFLVYSIFKILKQVGALIGGILGGLINSIYMSNFFSLNFPNSTSTRSGIIAAVSSMLLRSFILVLLISPTCWQKTLFLPMTSIFGYLMSYLLFKSSKKEKIKVHLSSPISFKFTFLYILSFTFLYFTANLLFKFFGKNVLFLITGIVGLIDVSTLSITLASILSKESIGIYLLLLTSTNIIGNSLFVLRNSKLTFQRTIKYLLILILVNVAFYFLIQI